MNQAGVAKFDPNAEEFQFYPLPDHMTDERTQQAMYWWKRMARLGASRSMRVSASSSNR